MSTGQQHYPNSPQYANGHPEFLAGQHRVHTCKYCDEEFEYDPHDPDKGFNEDYCSRDCKYFGIAYDALRSIRRDHTHCTSCFRKLKTLIPPGRNAFDSPEKSDFRKKTAGLGEDLPSYGLPDHPGAINVGGVVATEIAEPCYDWDVGEAFRPNPGEDDWEFHPYALESTKVCECGVAHHKTVDYLREDLTAAQAVRRTERLTEILDERIADDDWEHAYDKDTLFQLIKKFKNDEEQRAAGKDFEIFEKALGLAVKEAEYNV